MEMVVSYDHIYRGMELDATYLCTREVSLIVDVMYMVVLDDREYAAEIAYDTRLAAVMYIAVPYDM